MPAVVRWARLPHDGSVDAERHLAEIQATEEALDAIPQLAADLGTDTPITERLQHEYAKHLRVLHASDDGAEDEPALQYDRQYAALRQAVLAHKRATVLRSATSAVSTTSCCARCRPASTSRRSGCPGAS